jgi:hypothetical protein
MRCPRFPPDVDVGGDKDEKEVERRREDRGGRER